MDTKNNMVKRIELHFDKYIDRKVLEFIYSHPNKMAYIKGLIYKDFRRFKRNNKKSTTE